MSNTSVSFCGDSPFWDKELLINNSFPQFTECFRVTALELAPSVWLWVTGFVHLYYVKQNYSRAQIPTSILNISKIILCVLLMALKMAEGVLLITDRADLSTPVPLAYYTVTVVLSATYLFAAFLTGISRKALIVSPCILFIFWLFSVLTGIVHFYHLLNVEENAAETAHFKVFCAMFGALCVQFILSCWAETSLRQSINEDTNKPISPEVYASFPSKITFHWMTSLVYKGFKKSLAPTDIWDLPPQYKGQSIIAKFQNKFDECYKAFLAHNLTGKHAHKKTEAIAKQTSFPMKGPADNDRALHFDMDPFLKSKDTGKEKKEKRRKVPLFRMLIQTFYFELLYSNLIRLCGDCVQFTNPILLGALINYVQNKDDYRSWHGFVLVFGFFAVTFFTSMCQNQNFYHANNIGMKIKTALIATVYRKALNMTNETRRHFTMGAIVNFMSIDCQKMQNVASQLWVLLSAPLQISLAFYFLNDLLGLSFLVGVGIIIALIPTNARISLMSRRYQARQLHLKDQRLKMMNEILSGMKVIKLSAWEESFQKKISDIREEEVKCLKRAAMFQTVTVFNWICSPVLVTTGTLLTYTFVSDNQYLDPSIAFVALSLFNILKQPMNNLPNCISELVQGHVSLKRLRDFLSYEELSPSDVGHNTEEGVAISVKNGTFTWDRTQPATLTNIDLSITEGKLVAIMGPVGVGKSSLLCSFLGEMQRLKGTVSVKGSIAYVAQQAWIQNRSLKDGVIFDNPRDEKKYKEIITACALQPDIDMFAGGDMTEIGEKGINLSGGQKLRVTLARAVYHDADIYLLDDPLSAVDSHVGKHIFKEVIGNTGMLKHKTRVMVTHGVHWLPMCDVIVVMDQGRIIQTGTYAELLAHDGPFAQFLRTYLRQESEEMDPEIQEILGQMHTSVESITSESTKSAEENEQKFQKYLKPKKKEKEEEPKKPDGPSEGNKKGIQLIQEERSETKRVKAHVVKSLMKAFGLVPAIAAIILLFLYNGAGVSANIWLSVWTSDSLLRNTTNFGSSEFHHKTLVYVGVYAALGLSQAVATFFFVGTIYINMISASTHLHRSMLKTIMHQPMSFFDTNPLGRILNRFSRDVDAVDSSMARLIRMFAQQVFTVLSVMFVISYSTPMFLAAAIPLMIIYYFMQKFYIPCSRQLRRNESTSRSPIYAHFSESVSGAISIRAFGAAKKFKDESERLVDQNNVYFYAFISASRWLRVRLEILGNLIVVFAALLAVLGDLSGSLAGLSVSYALQVTMALNMLVQNSTQLESNIVSVERIVEYSNLEQEPEWIIPEKRPDKKWPTKGEVKFDGFSTRYRPGMDLVLHTLSCVIHGGEKVGVVGRTGAGKSSLSLSLFRLIEAAEGRIVIDDVTIADIGLHDLRSRLTILPQDPVLFSGTLRFNLDPLGQFSDDDLWSALEQAHLKNYVDSLPEGLQHEVDEGGLNLSVGQRQLVCLARALLRKARLLILDEATAAVDLETDELIQKTIRTAFKECTVFTVAHRLNTVMDYDKIMVLDKGHIVELDSPENLLEDINSVFYGLAKEARLVS